MKTDLPGILRDLHVYGGALIVGWGLGSWLGSGIGIAAFGAFLVYIGLFHGRQSRLKRSGPSDDTHHAPPG